MKSLNLKIFTLMALVSIGATLPPLTGVTLPPKSAHSAAHSSCTITSPDQEDQPSSSYTDTSHTLKHFTIADAKKGMIVAAVYDSKWWIGEVLQVSAKNDDMQIKFMHPPGPTGSFHWPVPQDKCWVPLTEVLAGPIPIEPVGQSFRAFKIADELSDRIESLFVKHIMKK